MYWMLTPVFTEEGFEAWNCSSRLSRVILILPKSQEWEHTYSHSETVCTLWPQSKKCRLSRHPTPHSKSIAAWVLRDGGCCCCRMATRQVCRVVRCPLDLSLERPSPSEDGLGAHIEPVYERPAWKAKDVTVGFQMWYPWNGLFFPPS